MRNLQFVILLTYNRVERWTDIMSNFYIIKDRLTEAMRVRGLNLSELAELSGLNKSSVSRYLTGKMIPRTAAIGKLAKVLDVSPTWILGYDVNMDGSEPPKIEIQKLNEENKARLFAYYQALIDSQGDKV